MSVLPLLNLLADGKFHSGDSLGECLGITRATIWNHLNRIEALGLEVHRVKGKGYRLFTPLELLDRELILKDLGRSDQALIQDIEIHETIDSTNSWLMQQLQERALVLGAGKVQVCLAEHQSAGRGRRGRTWVSPFGGNLYLSIARQFDTASVGLEGLSLAMALAMVRALEHLGIGGLGLKWPNDVLWGRQKLAGVLLELNGDITGTCQLVIGSGLNISLDQHSQSKIDQPWTDVSEILGKIPGRNRVASLVISEMLESLERYEQHGFEAFRSEWDRLDAMKGKEVVLSRSDEEKLNHQGIYGVVLGLDKNGALQLQTESGVQNFFGGELSLRRIGNADS